MAMPNSITGTAQSYVVFAIVSECPLVHHMSSLWELAGIIPEISLGPMRSNLEEMTPPKRKTKAKGWCQIYMEKLQLAGFWKTWSLEGGRELKARRYLGVQNASLGMWGSRFATS